MGPITVATGLGVADKILTFFGISPTEIGAKILGAGGDKKRRLMQIEMAGNMTAIYVSNTLKAIEGEPPEMQSKVKDGLLLASLQTLSEIVKAADLDGSSSNPS